MPDLKSPFIIGAMIAFAVLLSVIALLSFQLHSANKKITEQATTIGNLETANAQMKASVDNQNKKVDDLQAEGIKRAAAAAAAIKKAKGQAETYRARADAYLNRIATGDECQATNALLEEYRQGLQQ